MKKQLYFLLSVVVIIFLAVIANNWIESNKEEQRLIRQEQERMVEYTLENFEDVRKIEFTSFEQNFSTKFWHADAIINDNIYVSYSVPNINKGENIRIGFHIADSKSEKLKKRDEKRKEEIENINVIYKEY